jgi:hypothetical protein
MELASQREQMDIRRRKVLRYWVAGMNDREIAEKLGCAQQTVYNDRRYIYKAVREDRTVGEEAIGRVLTDYFAIITEHWRLYTSAEDDDTRTKQLNGLRKAIGDRAKLMQSFGLLPKAPERVELDARVVTCDVLMMILAELGKELPDEHRGPFFAKVRERLNGP